MPVGVPGGGGSGSVPKKGTVVTVAPPTPAPPAVAEQTGDGQWVVLSAIPGFTSPKVLKSQFRFQCAPIETMPQDYSWSWDDYPTIGSGYHSNPQYRLLSTFSFQSLFIDADYRYHFAQVKNVHVLGMVAALKAIGDTMQPFQLNFGQPPLWGVWDVAIPVTMRALHVEERAGEMDARYFTVSFTEYADAAVHNVVGATPAGSNTKALQKGMIATLDSSKLPLSLSTLAKISKYYYHQTAGALVIRKASGLGNVSVNEDLRVTYGHMRPPATIYVPVLKTAAPSGNNHP